MEKQTRWTNTKQKIEKNQINTTGGKKGVMVIVVAQNLIKRRKSLWNTKKI